jgi:hypothetical protein
MSALHYLFVKRSIFILFLILVLSFVTNQFSIAFAYSINNSEDAISMATNLLGFDKNGGYTKQVSINKEIRLLLATDSSSEYAIKYINGRTVWEETLRNIKLDLTYTNEQQESDWQKDFKILIDPASGQLLKIIFFNSDSNSVALIDSSFYYYDKAKEMGEKLLPIAYQSPSVSLLQALNKCKFYPLLAKNAICQYVMYSNNNLTARPTWVIFLYNMPPWTSPGGSVYSNKRYLIDANTGEHLPSSGVSIGDPPPAQSVDSLRENSNK